MARVQIEFINTCACCDDYGRIIQQTAQRYGDEVEVKLYYVGRDFDYLRKYGMINKGTMFINGSKKYENLSKDVIETAIKEAMEG